MCKREWKCVAHLAKSRKKCSFTPHEGHRLWRHLMSYKEVSSLLSLHRKLTSTKLFYIYQSSCQLSETKIRITRPSIYTHTHIFALTYQILQDDWLFVLLWWSMQMWTWLQMQIENVYAHKKMSQFSPNKKIIYLGFAWLRFFSNLSGVFGSRSSAWRAYQLSSWKEGVKGNL